MKRRNIILTFAIIALLLIGVGYAALSDTLTINGTVSTTPAEFDVQFVKATNNKNAVVSSPTNNGHTIELNFDGLQNLNDTVVFTVVVENQSVYLEAKLGTLTLAIDDKVADKDYFEISTDYVENKVLKASVGEVGAGDDSYTFTVTVKLVKVPAEGGATGTITGSFTGTAQEATA